MTSRRNCVEEARPQSQRSKNGNARNIFMLTIKRFETVADERDTEEFDNWPTHAHILKVFVKNQVLKC
jgi:hypothetical protein